MTLLGGRRLSAAVARILLAGLFMLVAGAVPAQAANSRLSVEGCSSERDNRSPNNWTSATWKVCIGDYSGAHGQVDTKCWAGQTIGWNAHRCLITGNFEIRKGNAVIKSGPFALNVPLDGVSTARPFRFYCQGHGEYTFSTTGVQGTLQQTDGDGKDSARPGYQSVNIADATAAVTMC